MMKSKQCRTLEEANRFYLRLCDRFDSVQLIQAPRFSEEGLYVWEVRE